MTNRAYNTKRCTRCGNLLENWNEWFFRCTVCALLNAKPSAARKLVPVPTKDLLKKEKAKGNE